LAFRMPLNARFAIRGKRLGIAEGVL
jgi:hypothetical protein